MEKARHEEMSPHEIVARSDRFPILLAAYSDPPLTTILYPMREVGALGTRLLIELMEDAEAQEPGSGSQHLPGGPEVVRGSEENEGLTDLWG